MNQNSINQQFINYMIKTLTVFVLTMVFFSFSAKVFPQGITLDISNKTVKEAIQIVKAKTGYSFVYEVKDIDTQRQVTVIIKNKSINEAVKQILKGQKVTYTIQGKNIVVTRIKKSSSSTNGVSNENSKKSTGIVVEKKAKSFIADSTKIKVIKINKIK